MLVFGLDCSVNHAGLVMLKDGVVYDAWFVTDVAKNRELAFDGVSFQDIQLTPKTKWEKLNEGCYESYRRQLVTESIVNCIMNQCISHGSKASVAIEDYAFLARNNSMTKIAEITGTIKSRLYKEGIQVRLHEPTVVKKWATGSGIGTKRMVYNAVVKAGFKIPEAYVKEGKKDIDGVATDIADAYVLADMLHTELMVRSGSKTIQELPANHRDCFLRVTKMNPVNLLSRTFE